MTTMTQTTRRSPLVARWELVTDARGRTRPEMRWAVPRAGAAASEEAGEHSLAA
jgi:hypothetical protein